MNYLSELFDQDFQHRTINAHRSAISAYHDGLEGKSIGKHPLVCALVAGTFNERPPQPRYNFIWSVNQVLNYISTLGNNKELFNKDLTLKLTMLLALTAAARVSSLKNLDIRLMSKGDDCYVFNFSKLHKAWEIGKTSQKVTYQVFLQIKIFVWLLL